MLLLLCPVMAVACYSRACYCARPPSLCLSLLCLPSLCLLLQYCTLFIVPLLCVLDSVASYCCVRCCRCYVVTFRVAALTLLQNLCPLVGYFIRSSCSITGKDGRPVKGGNIVIHAGGDKGADSLKY